MKRRYQLKNEPSTGLRILLIDDAEPLLMILETGLTNCGYIVFTAPSGRDALEIFKTNPIDVVICDLGMEEMNGWDVSKAVKNLCEEQGIPKTPFILLTGWGEDAAQVKDLESIGVDRIETKPVDIKGLDRVVQELVNSRLRGEKDPAR